MDVKKQWINHGSVALQRTEILSLKLTSSEWQIVTTLQHIFKQFAIAINQL
jgi:sulfur relay (sulfurtransferase) DsrC/TusE family protein